MFQTDDDADISISDMGMSSDKFNTFTDLDDEEETPSTEDDDF